MVDQCLLFAAPQAVKAIYTTTIINSMLFTIDARCLTFGSAESATVTLVGVNADFES